MSPGGPRAGPPAHAQRPPFMPPYQSPGMRQPIGSGPYHSMGNVPHGQTPTPLGTPGSQVGGSYPGLPGSPTPYPGMTQSMHANLPPQSAQQVTGNMS